MQIEIFLNFLINPKLVLTEIRPRYSWAMSLLAAALSVATLTMGNYIVFRSNAGISEWFLNSAMITILLMSAAYLYMPLVHALGERYMPQSKVSELLIYTGFCYAPLLLTLPFAAVCTLFNAGPFLYSVAVMILFFRILSNIVSGVRDNYFISPGRAAWLTLLPMILIGFLPFVLAVLALLMYS